MRIKAKAINILIGVSIIICVVCVILSIREFSVGTIKRDVASVHTTSTDGTIDYFTENPRQCKFFELYFDTFDTNQGSFVKGIDYDIDINKYPLKIEISTFSGFEYVILLNENQYDVLKVSLNDLEDDMRLKDIPTMNYIKTVNNVNYFTIEGVSDAVLSTYISSLKP